MHPADCNTVLVCSHNMNTNRTAVVGQYISSVQMLYTSYSKRRQSTCVAVEEKKLPDDISFHHHTVGSDS